MNGVSEPLAEHHRACDELLDAASEAAQANDWARYRALFAQLDEAIRAHFTFEEETLFPAFEQASGVREGPTRMMRLEHDHVRNILASLAAASPEHDPEGCSAELDNLFVILQQHNATEEGVLYPACDHMLGDALPALAEEASRLASGKPSVEELDVRALEPPEPFVRIMQRLAAQPRTPLRVRIHREPFPLYDVLTEQGYRYRAETLADGSYRIEIEPANP